MRKVVMCLYCGELLPVVQNGIHAAARLLAHNQRHESDTPRGMILKVLTGQEIEKEFDNA